MTLLKNKRAWKRWAKEHQSPGQNFPEPTQYPCWAYLTVFSFGYEEEQENYLSRENIEVMLAQMS